MPDYLKADERILLLPKLKESGGFRRQAEDFGNCPKGVENAIEMHNSKRKFSLKAKLDKLPKSLSCQRLMGRINQEIGHLLELTQQLLEQGELVQKLLEPSTDFNKMEREMLINMLKEVQQQAQEQEQLKEYWQQQAQRQEQFKEDLQRQVIRLLDEVEAIASGNLSVKVEVTPDIIGAVADSINQLINKQIEILQQLPPDNPIRENFQLPD